MEVLSLLISEVSVKYAHVATETAPNMLMIFRSGSATSVLSFTLGIYFSEFNQTARLPVTAAVTVDISALCCVDKSG